MATATPATRQAIQPTGKTLTKNHSASLHVRTQSARPKLTSGNPYPEQTSIQRAHNRMKRNEKTFSNRYDLTASVSSGIPAPRLALAHRTHKSPITTHKSRYTEASICARPQSNSRTSRAIIKAPKGKVA
jgi:hypothetical protein